MLIILSTKRGITLCIECDFFFSAKPRGTWDFSFLTKDLTHALRNGSMSPSNWTAKNVPYSV